MPSQGVIFNPNLIEKLHTMLLTITTTHRPATDIGYLLYKNPSRVHSSELAFGNVHVFYPEATAERCTVAVLLDIDPIGLVRGARGQSGEGFALRQYVNDRPYAISSFMSVALKDVFGTAFAGKSKERPELASTPIPLTASLSVLPCRGGEPLLRRLFEPLGYEVHARRLPLDETFPEWGDSLYFAVALGKTCLLKELLSHLYVLIPVLDNDKHYFVGSDEIDKLLRQGEGWLKEHPERDAIVTRYLKHQRHLRNEALERLTDGDELDPDTADEGRVRREDALETRISLNEQRLGAVTAVLKQCGAKRVLDLGCGEGKLLRRLLEDARFEEIVGADVSHHALEIAADRLRLDRMSDRQRQRIRLLQSSLTYRDKRLSGYDAATVIEVIEHLDPHRLAALERSLFEFTRAETIVVTTPNVEYNVKFETLPQGQFRHNDHRFEWTRREFQAWCAAAAEKYQYTVRYLPIGDEDPACGAPTQMGVFTRAT